MFFKAKTYATCRVGVVHTPCGSTHDIFQLHTTAMNIELNQNPHLVPLGSF